MSINGGALLLLADEVQLWLQLRVRVLRWWWRLSYDVRTGACRVERHGRARHGTGTAYPTAWRGRTPPAPSPSPRARHVLQDLQPDLRKGVLLNLSPCLAGPGRSLTPISFPSACMSEE